MLNTPIARFLSAALVMIATAVFLEARGSSEIFASRAALQTFPQHLADWTATDLAIDKDTVRILGPGDFLLRLYSNPRMPQPDINLFIAYFPSQRTGDTIHSPKNCLPGAGWSPVQSRRITLSMPGHSDFPANLYLIAKADSRQLVLYWYWAHNRGVASEYWAKYYLVADSIRMNRSDGALVRLSTMMYADETIDAALQRLLPFTSSVLPILDDYIPR